MTKRPAAPRTLTDAERDRLPLEITKSPDCPKIIAGLDAALQRFQLETGRRTADREAGIDAAQALGRLRTALEGMLDSRNRDLLVSLAWAVVGSKPAADKLVGNLEALLEEVAVRAELKGAPGAPRAIDRRNLALRIHNVLASHGLRVRRSREGVLEQTMSLVLEAAGEPASNPLRHLPPRATRRK